MINKKLKNFKYLFGLCIIVFLLIYIYISWLLPNELVLVEGEEYLYFFQNFLPIKADIGDSDVIRFKRDAAQQSQHTRLSEPLLLEMKNKGSLNLHVSIFGIIPIKSIKVDVIPKVRIVACGNTIGIKLKLDGILVIGMSEVETIEGKKILPVKGSEIKPGDFITMVNGKSVETINNLTSIINDSKGEEICIQYRSGEDYNIAYVKPVMSMDDKSYHIGLWVRDNTAGIGTLTYYEPETLYFGSLGHGITDMDTGVLVPAKWGKILNANILAVKKSENGIPGELKGIFDENRSELGTVNINSLYGIYGKLHKPIIDIEKAPEKIYPIGVKTQIKEGNATILANIEGKEVKEYEIEIQKVSIRNGNGSKSMVIKITDSRLLELTGGIVQGMSGSPIVQNGKIVGAVTHVLVNDPTKGYGIFIECMIKKMYENSMINTENAG